MTPKQLLTFRELIEKVNAEEKRASVFIEKLRVQLEELKENKSIDDYNLTVRLYCFSYDEKLNKKFSIEEGNPVYETSDYFLPDKENGLSAGDNWNSDYAVKDSPLEGIYFSYAMHCIIWHSGLELEDILRIDDVWIEVKKDYQFWTDKNV